MHKYMYGNEWKKIPDMKHNTMYTLYLGEKYC